jgi:hypothetical protein
MNGVIQGGMLSCLLSTQGVGSGVQSHLIGSLALPLSSHSKSQRCPHAGEDHPGSRDLQTADGFTE